MPRAMDIIIFSPLNGLWFIYIYAQSFLFATYKICFSDFISVFTTARKSGRKFLLFRAVVKLCSTNRLFTYFSFCTRSNLTEFLSQARMGEVGGNSLGFYGCAFSPCGNGVISHGFQGAFHFWKFSDSQVLSFLWMPCSSCLAIRYPYFLFHNSSLHLFSEYCRHTL